MRLLLQLLHTTPTYLQCAVVEFRLLFLVLCVRESVTSLISFFSQSGSHGKCIYLTTRNLSRSCFAFHISTASTPISCMLIPPNSRANKYMHPTHSLCIPSCLCACLLRFQCQCQCQPPPPPPPQHTHPTTQPTNSPRTTTNPRNAVRK